MQRQRQRPAASAAITTAATKTAIHLVGHATKFEISISASVVCIGRRHRGNRGANVEEIDAHSDHRHRHLDDE